MSGERRGEPINRRVIGVLKSIGEASGMMTFADEQEQKTAVPTTSTPSFSSPPVVPSGIAKTVAETSVPLPADDDTMAITFPQLYAREGVIGDSKTDPILTAFDRMAPALQGEPLHTAMNAMMQGMAADPSAIISTLDGRLVALDEALVTEKEKSQTRIDTRTKILAASKEEIGAAIRELERQIAELRQQLDEKERNTTQSNAQDIGATEAYVQNVATERTCLVALKTFLEGGRT